MQSPGILDSLCTFMLALETAWWEARALDIEATYLQHSRQFEIEIKVEEGLTCCSCQSP